MDSNFGVFEAVGLAWIILTSVTASAAFFYMAIIGIRVTFRGGILTSKMRLVEHAPDEAPAKSQVAEFPGILHRAD